MRRLLFIPALLVALAAAAPATGAVLLAKNCGSSCTTLQANGNGWVSVVGNGAEWGTVASGTVWVRDRTGGGNPKSWVHGSGLTWKYLGADGWKVTSKHSMTINATGKFWVKLQGPGVSVCGVVDGSGEIAGTGKYSLNGKSHSWSKSATSLHF
ncbi:MAG TPA: hypothetical protein VGL44_16430 [Gaiellales bacterium]|jgi:hypothetical protein